MRTLIVGALAATLAGCSCFVTPQSGLEACASPDGFACLDKSSSAYRWAGLEPSSSAASTTPAVDKAPRPAATKPRLAAHSGDKTLHATRTAKPAPDAAKVEPAAAVQPAEEIDPVMDRAKIAVLVKLADPKSATFGEMKRKRSPAALLIDA